MTDSKKGFTIAELTVVIAVISIIVTMTCGFILTFQRKSETVQANKDAVADINNVRIAVDEWINSYDSIKYDIRFDPEEDWSLKAYEVISDTESAMFAELVFEDGCLVWKTDGIQTKTYTFTQLSDCSFSVDNNTVFCNVVCSERNITLLFNIFSKTERNRYSNADRYSR